MSLYYVADFGVCSHVECVYLDLHMYLWSSFAQLSLAPSDNLQQEVGAAWVFRTDYRKQMLYFVTTWLALVAIVKGYKSRDCRYDVTSCKKQLQIKKLGRGEAGWIWFTVNMTIGLQDASFKDTTRERNSAPNVVSFVL
jgi:hypothetical protein